MNPQLAFEIDFSFFSSFLSFFSSKKEEKTQNYEDKLITKKYKKIKILKNISKKYSNASLETAFTEDENEHANVKETQFKKKYEDFIICIKEDSDEENILNMDRKKIDIKRVNKQIIKEEKKDMKIYKKLINKKSKKTEDDLLLFLSDYIKNVFIFRKKVKLLIQKHKEYYAILGSENKNYLPMNIQINNEKNTKLKYTYEPILDKYFFYISRKLYRNTNLIKFNFVNKKNESIVDPKLSYIYDKGAFYNIINLKKIRKKEKRNTKEFLIFLDKYYRIKQISNEKIEEGEEKNKISLGKTIHKKIPYYPILKKRPIKRIASNKKITFAGKDEYKSYKKD